MGQAGNALELITANSVALIGWGPDCAIQAVASLVIIWRFTGDRIHSDAAELKAQRVVAVSFFLLAPYIVVEAIDHLATGNASHTSWLGIGLAATDMLLMPVLGRAKKQIGNQLGSATTAGEGRQNILCAYLSLGVLAGLSANPLLGWWWMDPIVGLLVAIVVVQAGMRTWRGQGCDDVTGTAAGSTSVNPVASASRATSNPDLPPNYLPRRRARGSGGFESRPMRCIPRVPAQPYSNPGQVPANPDVLSHDDAVAA